MLIPLTGIAVSCHCRALIVHHTYSNNRDVVGASRLKIVQQEPVVFSQIGAVNAGHTEVVTIVVHAVWKCPGKVDGLHSLRHHCDGARRVGN